MNPRFPALLQVKEKGNYKLYERKIMGNKFLYC